MVLQREGWSVGRKLVYRLYREENRLLRPKKRRRRVSHQARVLQSTPHQLNEQWSMDFMSDALVDGRRIRVLTIVATLVVRVYTSGSGLIFGVSK